MADHPIVEDLFRRYQALWHRIALQYVRRPEEAQDVVQEAYRKFIGVQRDWQSLEDARRYFSVVLTHTAIDFYKIRRRQEERVIASEAEELDRRGAAQEWHPSRTAQEREREVRLLGHAIEILRELPAEQREAIQLLFLDEEERSLSDISRAHAIPISTLRSRALIGLEKLRKKLRKKRLL